ncbi:MAG TPA: cytochrome P450, partial [Gemmatimonadales bacterium]|nr:cytochrome P450 [Gemmatimonadales bacterium]
RTWAGKQMSRHGAENLILNFGFTKILLVGGHELSRHILAPPPRSDGFAVGKLKRNSMAALAPHALTISDDEQWTRLRPFNEGVLCSGRPHAFGQGFVEQVHRAFSVAPATIDDIRRSMGRVMSGVVFGDGVAPDRLTDEVQWLFDLVQHPVKRILLGPWARRRRARFYHTLRDAWRATAGSPPPSLLGLAHGAAGNLAEEQLLQQVPHWMFTFTGSGTDLLARTLALVTSHPDTLARARSELASAGPLDQAETIGRLTFAEACLMEAARMYPPVTRTFHRAPAGANAGAVRVPAGMEILHSFPLLGRSPVAVDEPKRFQPERWLSSAAPALAGDFDPFLSGARHCPGRELIVLVCKTALAILLGPMRVVVETPLARDALPEAFPADGIRFRPEHG